MDRASNGALSELRSASRRASCLNRFSPLDACQDQGPSDIVIGIPFASMACGIVV